MIFYKSNSLMIFLCWTLRKERGRGRGLTLSFFFFIHQVCKMENYCFWIWQWLLQKKKKIIWLFVFFPFGLSSLIQKKKFLDVIFNIPYKIIPVLKSWIINYIISNKFHFVVITYRYTNYFIKLKSLQIWNET